MEEQADLLELTARIVESNVAGAGMSSEDVSGLIKSTYETLAGLGQEAEPEEEKPERAVTVRKSLANKDHIISMIDGKPYRTLKRHLSTHGYTPESYREAFNLPADYPMVAPNYSAQRSAMAKDLGLGRKAGQKRGRRKASS